MPPLPCLYIFQHCEFMNSTRRVQLHVLLYNPLHISPYAPVAHSGRHGRWPQTLARRPQNQALPTCRRRSEPPAQPVQLAGMAAQVFPSSLGAASRRSRFLGHDIEFHVSTSVAAGRDGWRWFPVPALLQEGTGRLLGMSHGVVASPECT
jgi:hypothetical protein